MLGLTEKQVENYEEILKKEVTEDTPPAVVSTLESLVAVGSKLISLYTQLLDSCDEINSKQYTFLSNEILRTEKNFVVLQGIYTKLMNCAVSETTEHR